MLEDFEQVDFFGNKNHLKVLISAISHKNALIWNQWKNNLKNEEIDLRGLNLSQESIGNCFLKDFDFSHGDLEDSTFLKQTFEHCLFDYTNLTNVCFGEVKLVSNSFVRARVSGTNFIGTKIEECNFSNSTFTYSVLMVAKITNSIFTGTNFFSTNINHNEITSTICDYIYTTEDGKQRYPKEGILEESKIKQLFSKHIFITAENIHSLTKK